MPSGWIKSHRVLAARLAALLVVAAVQVVSFGVFIRRIGFYYDDWPFIEMGRRAGGLPALIKAYAAHGSFWDRPVEILQLPLFYALCGDTPLRHQLLILGLQTVEGMLLFVVLEGLLASRGLALSAACFALMYPNRAVTHLWYINTPQNVALVLVLASLLAHQKWLSSRRKTLLALGQSLYLLALLSYESVAFMPLMLAGGLAAKTSPRRAAKEISPYLPTLILALAWQWLGVPLLLGASRPKSALFSFSIRHLLSAFAAGFDCVVTGIPRLCAENAHVLGELGAPLLLVGAAFSLITGVLLSRALRKEDEGRGPLPTAGGAAALGFFGAYAPYALSGTYLPQFGGAMSRTNATGAWIGGLLIALLLAAARRRLPALAHAALTAFLVAAFTWTNWHHRLAWAESWTLQQDVLKKASVRAAKLPRGATVLLAGVPHHLNGAVVFDAHWDFSAALRLSTGRADLEANVVSDRMVFYRDKVVEMGSAGVHKTYPARNLYLYDYARGSLTDLGKLDWDKPALPFRPR